MFAAKRAERAGKEKLAELQRQRKRHPQSASLVAAVFGDPELYDLLHRRTRQGVLVTSEFGTTQAVTTTDRILELENISTLFVLLSAIAANGGRPVQVSSHGAVGDELPHIAPSSLSQLVRNGLLASSGGGTRREVGLGERVREVAKRWGITLPEPVEAEPEAVVTRS